MSQLNEMSSHPSPRPDIQNSADIERVVSSFYGNIEEDPLLGPFFGGVNWEAHLPKMTAFWSSVMFHTGEYKGRPFDPHARLEGLERSHFEQWLKRFHLTVDSHFEGENAERMKQKAEQIATIFQVKLGMWTTINHEAT